MPESILIVEDEPALRDTLSYNLKKDGFTVEAVGDGRAALESARRLKPDLIVLDLMLPGMDGLEVCRTLRREGKRTPIIILTAKGGEDDRVRGLQVGADDYVPKPFSVRELLARVTAQLRRSEWGAPASGPTRLESGEVTIDLQRLECRRPAGAEALTPKEVEILRYLALHRDRVVSRGEFLTAVWGYPAGAAIETRTVENTIVKLRHKVEPDPKHPALVLTVHGAGWKLGDGVRCDA
jgi:two-component system alkaline phosphatase synthesis response regulator PhoP